MYAKFSASLAAILLLLSSAASLYGCSGGGTGTDTGTAPEAGMEAGTKDDTNSDTSAVSDTGGSRPNTPTIYEPEAPQTEILGGEPLIIDISNTSQGYVMARYTGSAAKANVQITGPDGIHYKYFLAPSDSFTSLPLSSGDGTYQIDGYENISGNQYAVLFFLFCIPTNTWILMPARKQSPQRRRQWRTLPPTWTLWQTSIIS